MTTEFGTLNVDAGAGRPRRASSAIRSRAVSRRRSLAPRRNLEGASPRSRGVGGGGPLHRDHGSRVRTAPRGCRRTQTRPVGRLRRAQADAGRPRRGLARRSSSPPVALVDRARLARVPVRGSRTPSYAARSSTGTRTRSWTSRSSGTAACSAARRAHVGSPAGAALLWLGNRRRATAIRSGRGRRYAETTVEHSPERELKLAATPDFRMPSIYGLVGPTVRQAPAGAERHDVLRHGRPSPRAVGREPAPPARRGLDREAARGARRAVPRPARDRLRGEREHAPGRGGRARPRVRPWRGAARARPDDDDPAPHGAPRRGRAARRGSRRRRRLGRRTARGRRSAFRELEVEIGDEMTPGLLDALVERLRQAGAGAPDQTAKYIRALGADAPLTPEIVVNDLGPDATAGDVVQRALALSGDPAHPARRGHAARRRSRGRAPGTRRHPTAPLRSPHVPLAPRRRVRVVARRRARLARAHPRRRARRRRSPRAASPTGGRAARGRSGCRSSGACDPPGRPRRGTCGTPRDGREPRYVVLLDRLVDAANDPAFGDDASAAGVGRRPRPRAAAVAQAREARREARRRARPTRSCTQIRIRTKRARYAAEAATPVVGKPARALRTRRRGPAGRTG